MQINSLIAGLPDFQQASNLLRQFCSGLTGGQFGKDADVAAFRKHLGECVNFGTAHVQAALQSAGTPPYIIFGDLGPISHAMTLGSMDGNDNTHIYLNRELAKLVNDATFAAPEGKLLCSTLIHEMSHFWDRKGLNLVNPPGGPGNDIGAAVERHCIDDIRLLIAQIAPDIPPPADPDDNPNGFYEVAEGMPRGIRNRNPGNIRQSGDAWKGLATFNEMTEYQKRETNFCVFSEHKWGLRALARILKNYQLKHKKTTVQGMITRWAPPIENNTDAYVDTVAKQMGISATQAFNFSDESLGPVMLTAIIKHENGNQPYTANQIRQGHALGVA